MSIFQDFEKAIKNKSVSYVDFRFTDLRGGVHHTTLPINKVNSDCFTNGVPYDGSSIAGFEKINESDMVLIPTLDNRFFEYGRVVLFCDVYSITPKFEPYEKCSRVTARKAVSYMQNAGIADKAYFGPECEFYVFDKVKVKSQANKQLVSIESIEGPWKKNNDHLGDYKTGYIPVAPKDKFYNLRDDLCNDLKHYGIDVEMHHHEVGVAGQQEIDFKFDHLLNAADKVQIYKYVVHNFFLLKNMIATFMPKPIMGDNGSGMHCHQSLWNGDRNLFSKSNSNFDVMDNFLSDEARYYIGGLIKHARALCAFIAPTTNSYRRLIPGFEAPVILAYSEKNRSAAIRIPAYINNENQVRLEFRTPDPTANPYLAFAAMLMAGIDGIENKIEPPAPVYTNLYEMTEEEVIGNGLSFVCGSLREAIDSLKADSGFLNKNGVFSRNLIDSYISLLEEDISRVKGAPHPMEFKLYLSS